MDRGADRNDDLADIFRRADPFGRVEINGNRRDTASCPPRCQRNRNNILPKGPQPRWPAASHA